MSISHTSLFRDDTNIYSSIFANSDMSFRNVIASQNVNAGQNVSATGSLNGASASISGQINTGSLNFPSGGATPLNYYRSETATLGVTDGAGTNFNISFYFERIGNIVRCTLRGFTQAVLAGSVQISNQTGVLIPINYRPTSPQGIGSVIRFICQNATTGSAGTFFINSDGTFGFNRLPALVAFGAGNIVMADTTVVYSFN